MSLVLDSSAALGWIYLDEASETATAIFGLVADAGAWVPSLWRIEIANSLQNGVRRGRIAPGFRDTALRDLARLDVAIDPETDTHAWSATLGLAERYALTVYDAAYLELALRRSLPLGSLDNALCTAAARAGVAVISA